MSQGTGPGRRGFLVAVGRYGFGLLLGGGVGAMVARDGDECINLGVCRGCAVLDTCELAEAVLARRTTRDGQRQAG